MSELTRKGLPCGKTPDSAIFVQKILYSAGQEGLMSAQQNADLQSQLWGLLKRQTERYTMGDSSSVPVERAQDLLASIYYSIGIELQETEDELPPLERLLNHSLSGLFQSGQQIIRQKVEKGKQLLKGLQQSCIDIDNISYYDTVYKALPLFFRQYDSSFFAHETPCDIDYQLCMPVGSKRGIVYILEYMRRLKMENIFCSRFDIERMRRLLQGYCPDYKEQLINLFEPVFYNAIGLVILGIDIVVLDMTERDKRFLFDLLQKLSGFERKNRIYNAVKNICDSLSMEDMAIRSYLYAISNQFCVRLDEQLKTGDLGDLFISFPDEDGHMPLIHYSDGMPMPDEGLRQLLEEIQSCRYLSDKLLMVKENVHSLRDLIEILRECFWDEEYTRVFASLQDMELTALLKHLQDIKGDDLPVKELNEEWENRFLDYLGTLDKVSAEEIQQTAQRIRFK